VTRVRIALAVVTALVATACGVGGPPVDQPGASARIIFAGDVMMGRGVAPVAAADPDGLFAGVRRVLRAADLAVANLESPLTTRPHTSANPHHLEADPRVAPLLAGVGFDLLGIANNHAGDAGPESVLDTIAALVGVGVAAVGGGPDLDTAWAPVVKEVGGVVVAFLAIDVSHQGLTAGADTPGVASWDEERAREAVVAARSAADVVAVGIHGGVGYLTGTDPQLAGVARILADAGADIVWGTGPHVAQPVTLVERDGRPAVVATSLGNFLFDQRTPATSHGLLLEVLVDLDGVAAYRVGSKHHDDLRVHFDGWEVPAGDAVLLHGSWWHPARPLDATEPAPLPDLTGFTRGDVVAAAIGDLTGDGRPELLVSYRRPARDPTLPQDAQGRTAHLGVLTADLVPMWLSARPPHPVGSVAACDGSAAFTYTGLDDLAVVAVGGGVWNGFGFTLADDLPGPGVVGCVDVDGDGRTEPLVRR
jgi:hypothetical protein